MTAAEFDDQATPQALASYGGGEFGSGGARLAGAGRRRAGDAPVGGSRLPLRVHQFEADHQASPAHLADAGEVTSQVLELGQHVGAEGRRAFGEAVLADVGQGGGARGHGELVAAEGSRVGPGPPDVQVVAVDHDGQRQTAADGLGQHHHIRCHAAVLHRPEGTRAPDPRLDLVGDQRDGPFRGELPHASHPVVGRGNHPALALHGFEDHPGGQRHSRLGVVQHGLGPAGGEFGTSGTADAEGAAVVLRVGQARDPYVGGVPRGVERSRGHPVVGAGEGHDGPAAGGGPDELEGGLHRVRTGRAAELHARVVGEPGRQGAEQLGDEGVLDRCGQVEGVQGRARVEDLADGLQDDGVVVSEGEGAGAREAVQVAAAVRALDGEPAGPHRHDRQGARIGARRRLARRLTPQNPLVRGARPRGRAASRRRIRHGHGSLSFRCPKAPAAHWNKAPAFRCRVVSPPVAQEPRTQATGPPPLQPRTGRAVTGRPKIVAVTPRGDRAPVLSPSRHRWSTGEPRPRPALSPSASGGAGPALAKTGFGGRRAVREKHPHECDGNGRGLGRVVGDRVPTR